MIIPTGTMFLIGAILGFVSVFCSAAQAMLLDERVAAGKIANELPLSQVRFVWQLPSLVTLAFAAAIIFMALFPPPQPIGLVVTFFGCIAGVLTIAASIRAFIGNRRMRRGGAPSSAKGTSA